MFLMIGMTEGRKDLDYDSGSIICDRCGSYGRYQVFMTYMCLSLFFIPIFKWNRHYYVQTSCCSTLYELDSEIGSQIARGYDVEIEPGDLTVIQQGRGMYLRCRNCGYSTREDFEYCPRCGRRFDDRT